MPAKSEILKTTLTVGLSVEFLDAIDEYARLHHGGSRNECVRQVMANGIGYAELLAAEYASEGKTNGLSEAEKALLRKQRAAEKRAEEKAAVAEYRARKARGEA